MVSSVSHVLLMCDQPFHLMRNCCSVSSVSRVRLGSPFILTVQCIVHSPVAPTLPEKMILVQFQTNDTGLVSDKSKQRDNLKGLVKFRALRALLSRLLGRFAPIFYFICKTKIADFIKNFVDFQNFQKSNFDGGKFLENLIIHKPSLGSRNVPQKIWA